MTLPSSTNSSGPCIPPSVPEEYYMCSKPECQERQSSGEISIFESQWPPPTPNNATTTTTTTTTTKQPRRIVDPRFAMTKYRRSAAGVDATNRTPPRSLPQLECCLSLLEYILCHQQQPPTSSSATNNQNFPKQTLTGTVSFVEDRIRALQVELVVSQQSSALLQYRMARCHVLILYLLGQVATYESKFGLKALSAALTNYWDDDKGSKLYQDEMLCLMALHQLCQYIVNSDNDSQRQDSNETLSNILDYYRRNIDISNQTLTLFPKFEWAMKLVDLAVIGRPQTILRRLVELGTTSFAILCRCCMAPAVNFLRLQALHQYNKSFMKGEKVAAQELARLLYFETADHARTFATQVAGLTLHDDGDKIVFKVGPVQGVETLADNIYQRQDAFVFGSLYSWNDLENLHTPTTSEVTTAWDDLPTDRTLNKSDKQSPGALVDAEGVLVPPPILLQQILQDSLKL